FMAMEPDTWRCGSVVRWLAAPYASQWATTRGRANDLSGPTDHFKDFWRVPVHRVFFQQRLLLQQFGGGSSSKPKWRPTCPTYLASSSHRSRNRSSSPSSLAEEFLKARARARS